MAKARRLAIQFAVTNAAINKNGDNHAAATVANPPFSHFLVQRRQNGCQKSLDENFISRAAMAATFHGIYHTRNETRLQPTSSQLSPRPPLSFLVMKFRFSSYGHPRAMAAITGESGGWA